MIHWEGKKHFRRAKIQKYQKGEKMCALKSTIRSRVHFEAQSCQAIKEKGAWRSNITGIQGIGGKGDPHGGNFKNDGANLLVS